MHLLIVVVIVIVAGLLIFVYGALRRGAERDYQDWSSGGGNPRNRCPSCDSLVRPAQMRGSLYCPNCGAKLDR
jgi:hypothetical protein